MKMFFSSFAEPLALGLSTGTWCAMYCVPVLLPFLLGRDESGYKKNSLLIAFFLLGRLAAYGAIGFALSRLGLLAMEYFDPVLARRLSSGAYLVCGIVLASGIYAGRCASCKTALSPDSAVQTGSRRPGFPAEFESNLNPRRNALAAAALLIGGGDRRVSFLSGMSVGFHICPAFWTAAFRSADSPSAAGGVLYFSLFYIGTLPFFLPLAGVPFASARRESLRRIARTTQLLIGAYFIIFAGFIPLAFGR
ncbi:MAG TPA: sulfite exporter TauE/SafE family protein [Treponemataceae bacterium]|nr:sulfite exporter TauE/SafE family protein [Treponemataceae bacterium]